MTRREKQLRNTLISVVIGVVIALMLIMTVPDLQRDAEMVIYFLLYWLLGTFAVTQAFDLSDYLKHTTEVMDRAREERHADKAC